MILLYIIFFIKLFSHFSILSMTALSNQTISAYPTRYSTSKS